MKTVETPAQPAEGLGTVIVGAGHAGVECALALRTAGYALPITLISDEDCQPYQRPPLSKAFLAGTMAQERLSLRSPQVYEKQAVEVITGDRVVEIDSASKLVLTASGRHLSYSHCVIATGAHARPLPALHGSNVYSVRNIDDALALQPRLNESCRMLVVGGGYLGLEIAGTASKLGAQVVVFEHSPYLMSGKVSQHASSQFEAMHNEAGIRLMRGAMIVRWEALAGGAWRAHLSDGSSYDGDVVLISVGAVPNIELAEQAGVVCEGGIVVDEHYRSSIPTIFAIGDCASAYRPELALNARVESVQNALDSARAVAAAIAGMPQPARRPATFWSEQLGRRLQIAGIINPGHPVRDLVAETSNGWVVERYQHGVLACIEALDSPMEFVKALKRVGVDREPTGHNEAHQYTETIKCP